jgi:hypothetical protein
MAYLYALTDTWNDGAATFNGIKLNITDIASAAASSALELQRNGITIFKVSKDGNAINIGSTGTTAGISAPDWLLLGGSASSYEQMIAIRNGQLNLASNMQLYWSSSLGPADNTNGGAFGIPDGSDTYSFGRQSPSSASKIYSYNTFTDASNYERAAISWSGNVLTIGTQAAGTGTKRALAFDASNISYTAAGLLTLGGDPVITSSNWTTIGGSNSATGTMSIRNNALQLASSTYLGWSTSTTVPAQNANNGRLEVAAANTFSFGRGSVNSATKLHVFNAFTDASNYERAVFSWASNVLTIGTEALGTGTKRNLVLDGANRAAYDAAPSTAVIRDILISHGLMAAA